MIKDNGLFAILEDDCSDNGFTQKTNENFRLFLLRYYKHLFLIENGSFLSDLHISLFERSNEEEGVIKKDAEILIKLEVIKTEIKAMESANQERLSNDEAIAYDSSDFIEKSHEIKELLLLIE